jgi:hypothetical protein
MVCINNRLWILFPDNSLNTVLTETSFDRDLKKKRKRKNKASQAIFDSPCGNKLTDFLSESSEEHL